MAYTRAMSSPLTNNVAIIGAGPAGLMAAEVLAQGGAGVTVHDAMASVGRKFLMAGRGGLNLTHSEPLPEFLVRYGQAMPRIRESSVARGRGRIDSTPRMPEIRKNSGI